MEILDEELVDIDLNDYSSDDDNQYNFENSSPVSNNDECLVHNIEIPLIENSVIQDVKEDKIDYDKYGFKKSYKYISKKRQEEYEIYYQRVLERREQKWNLLLEEHGGEFPPMSSKLKRFIRKGIPGYIRSLCWFYYSGAKVEMENNKGLYVQLLKYEYSERNKGLTKKDSKSLDCIYAIEKDLFRTFPDNKYFAVDESVITMDNEDESAPNKKYYINPYIGSLRNILVAFAYYSLPKADNGYGGTSYTIGYCQSLNYIAGLLLLIFSQNNDKLFKTNVTAIEEMCFWVFVTLIDKILPREMYGENDMEGAIIEQELLWNLIIDENGRKFGVKKVAKWKKDMEKKNNMNGMDGVPDSQNLTKLGILTFKWMTTCFVGVLPIETVLRVWDCIFTEGYITIIRVTLTLLRIYENDISKNDDELEGWDFINNLPYKIIDCHRFMEICFRPRYSINPLKNLYYSITLVNPITNQLELKKNFENTDSSNTEVDYAQLQLQQEQQQQHEIQQQQHQQQLYQILQNQQMPNPKHGHQRNKSFSSFLSIKYKNQPQSMNNSFYEKSNEIKSRNNTMHTIEFNKEDHNKRLSLNINSNYGSTHTSSDNLKDSTTEKKDEIFSNKKHKKRNHTKSYSENTQNSDRYMYDSVNNNNNNFEGSFYNKISTALKNRKLTNSKKASSQKNSYKNNSNSKKSNTESSAKKKSNNKKSITNFDILKKQLENIGNKKKTDDTSERSKKSNSNSKEDAKNKSGLNTNNTISNTNTTNSDNAALSDNQTIKNDNNKNYYNTLNESINNSIEINNNGSEYSNNDSSSIINSKKELYTIKHDSKSIYSNNINDFNNSNELSEINKDCEKKDNLESISNSNNNSKEKDENLIIVKPFCQINTSNEILNSSPSSSHLNMISSSQMSYSDDNVFESSEESIKNLGDSKDHMRNKVLKYKNKNEKTNVISLFNNDLMVNSSNSNDNLSSYENINSSNFSSNEKVISSSDESLTKSKRNENDTKVTNNDLNNVVNRNKNNINNQLLEVPCSPSLSVVSQSSASSQSSDLTCSSMSYSGSEDEDDEDDEQFFFSINELSGTINGDLIKLNENKKNESIKGDSNSINSNEPKRTSYVSLNNDIIIKTIEEKLKEKIIDKQQNFKYLDLLNGSKIGPSYPNQNHTKHKRNALSYQYNMINDTSEQNKYFSLNNLHKKSHSLSRSLNSGGMKENKNSTISSINKSENSQNSLNDSQELDSSNEFRSFVDIYYQYDDKIIKVSGNNINNIGDSNKFNDDFLPVPNSNGKEKKHCTFDTNSVVINQNNDDVKAKGPDFRVYCSTDINSSIVNSHNTSTISSFQEERSLDKQKMEGPTSGYDSNLDFNNIDTGVLHPSYSQSTTSSSNELTKPVIILSSERINEYCSPDQVRKPSCIKYYITPDGSLSNFKDGNTSSLNNINENVIVSDDINKRNNEDECIYSGNVKENVSNGKTSNDTNVTVNTKTDNQNISNISNNKEKNNKSNEEEDKLSPLSSSSNNDLIEQMQVFWRVTFPKNEGYHLVLRKGGIGNLSNKVINKYRKKLWEKRNKEKMKKNNSSNNV